MVLNLGDSNNTILYLTSMYHFPSCLNVIFLLDLHKCHLTRKILLSNMLDRKVDIDLLWKRPQGNTSLIKACSCLRSKPWNQPSTLYTKFLPYSQEFHGFLSLVVVYNFPFPGLWSLRKLLRLNNEALRRFSLIVHPVWSLDK